MLNFENFIRARAALTGRAAEQRAERFGRPIAGAAFDEDFMAGGAPDADGSAPIAFHVVYSDSKGALTGRCITVRGLREEIEEIRVSAVCHYRQALRCFLASRMVEVTDLATGEVHDDGLDFFRAHPLLRPVSADTLAGMSDELLALQETRDEVILLTMLSASDGMLHPDELDEIVKHVCYRFDGPLDEEGIRRRVAGFVPDEHAFHLALRRICNGAGDARALMTSMRRVVDADGRISGEEVAFVAEIESRLRAAGRL